MLLEVSFFRLRSKITPWLIFDASIYRYKKYTNTKIGMNGHKTNQKANIYAWRGVRWWEFVLF